MPVPRGTYYRIRTYASGKKVRLAIAPSGKIIEATPVLNRVRRTKIGKRLARKRRRIGR